MSRILLLYASSHGQTRAIADAIVERLREYGHEIELIDAQASAAAPPPTSFDAVILGSRVHYGQHARSITGYAQRHHAALRDKPTGFFSVGLSAAANRAEPHLAQFSRSTQLSPWRAAAFAGRVDYPRYGLLVRLLMKGLCRSVGLSTDTSRSHVYTDWEAVVDFADEIASGLAETNEVTEELPLSPLLEPSMAGVPAA